MARNVKSNPRLMLDVIRSVIKDKYIPADQTQMVERNTNGRKGKMACKICTHTEELLLCSFDERANNYRHFPYFQQVEGMVSMCDYILFVEDVADLYVFSIDLKDSSNGPKKQTSRAKVFAEFILNRIRVVRGEKDFPKVIHYGQIGIKTTCNKMTTKGYDEMSFDEDNYMVLPDYHQLHTRVLMDLL